MIKDKTMIQEKVLLIFSKYCDRPVCEKEKLSDLGLDSLEFIKLIIELEDSFNIEIEDEELYIKEIVKISDYVDYIYKVLQ